MSGHELSAPPWARVEGTLMSTARDVRRAYDRGLKRTGVNLKEASVLAHLGDAGPLSQSELAVRIGAGRANVGVVVDALEQRGLAARQDDPNDRRAWRVELTTSGRRVWKETVEVDRAIRRELRVGITAVERDLLDSLLLRIHHNAQGLLDD